MATPSVEKLRAFLNNRWFVFTVSVWIQCCAGVAYLFGSISPVIKSSMGYNQTQIAMLGVAKNLGDCIGFISGALSEILPFWAILTIGVLQSFFGYGFVWMIITNRLPALPLWVLCIAMFIATNGETYYNTTALVSCVQNFPNSRGPIVGILKGFSGLSGAILTQIYHIFSSTNQASLILMIAVGPSSVVLCLMFFVRHVEGQRQVRPSDGLSFTYVYSICLILAAYLMCILLLEDQTELSKSMIIVFSVVLFIILLLPLIIPVILAFFAPPPPYTKENLLSLPLLPESEALFSEIESEDEKMLIQAEAEGAVRVTRPRRGEDFTLKQALVKADFWLMFISLIIAAGSGVTIIDNMGQMTQSLGYKSTIFVSMISIWNFLGRVAGGYFSELVVRNYAYPRPLAMAVFQVIMAIGLLYYAMDWPGSMYIVTLLCGFGYGAHWAIVPAAVSELFGLKSFGVLYNFLLLAMPMGSFLFSELIASNIYEYYAEKQAGLVGTIQVNDVATCTGTICYSVTCAILSGLLLIAVGLSLLVVHRTRGVYAKLYAKSP